MSLRPTTPAPRGAHLRWRARLAATLLAVASALGGCDDPSPPERAPAHPPEPTPVPSHAGAPDDDPLGPLDPGDAPLPPARAACIRALRERTPDAVRRTLEDLGWPHVFEDVCTTEQALSSRARSACDELSVRTLRTRCQARVAIAAGRPEDCPEERVGEGHEPRCVALAARRPALCRAVPPPGRLRCEAAFRADPAAACRADPDPTTCVEEARRLADDLRRAGDDASDDATDAPEPDATLEVIRLVPGAEAAPREAETLTLPARVFERGARLRFVECRAQLELGEDREPALGLDPSISLRLVLLPASGDSAGPPPLPRTLALGPEAQLAVRLPALGEADEGTGTVTLEALEPILGGRIEGRLDATLARSPGALRVRGTFRTFVRDVLGTPCTPR